MANTTERIGVSYCSLIAAKTEWMFREQPIDDIGIDAHMERTDTDGKVQQLLALQIKSGESYFKENKGDYVVFRDIDDRQYNYWTTNTLPCIVVLYNPKDDMCIWQKLSVDTIQKTCGGTGKGYYVNVPTDQVFLDDMPNPTNEVVAPYYGVGPLWKTEYSQGIVVRAEDDDDYYIVMECSSKNKGYKHTKVILTMGGCM